jgi:dihydrofolate reductase
MRSSVPMVWGQAAGRVIGADGAACPGTCPTICGCSVRSPPARCSWAGVRGSRCHRGSGRRNAVLSSRLDAAEAGVEVARSVDDVLPHAEELVVTEVDAQLPGDTWAPPLGLEWLLGTRVPVAGWAESDSGLRFRVSQWRHGTATPGPVPQVLVERLATWTRAGESGGVGAGR